MELATIAAVGHHPWFEHIVRTYGYLALFGIIAAQDAGIPTLVPGSLILLYGGYLASTGALNPVIAGLAATAGALGGSSLLFMVARLGGEAVFRRFGRFMRMDIEQHARLDRALRRWGLLAWIVTRFLPGLRAATSLIAGIGGMPYREFALLTAVASLIWAYTFVFLGVLLGRHWRVAARVALASGPVALVCAVLIVGIVLLVRVWRARRLRTPV